jgi:hypothetical protein
MGNISHAACCTHHARLWLFPQDILQRSSETPGRYFASCVEGRGYTGYPKQVTLACGREGDGAVRMVRHTALLECALYVVLVRRQTYRQKKVVQLLQLQVQRTQLSIVVVARYAAAMLLFDAVVV